MRWVTPERVQSNRLATAWLIRRSVATDAACGFLPRGTEASAVQDATPFQLPGAGLMRREGASTFAVIRGDHRFSDSHPALWELGAPVRAADVLHGPAAWRGTARRGALSPEPPSPASGLQVALHGVRLLAGDDAGATARAEPIMDAVSAARSRGTK